MGPNLKYGLGMGQTQPNPTRQNLGWVVPTAIPNIFQTSAASTINHNERIKQQQKKNFFYDLVSLGGVFLCLNNRLNIRVSSSFSRCCMALSHRETMNCSLLNTHTEAIPSEWHQEEHHFFCFMSSF